MKQLLQRSQNIQPGTRVFRQQEQDVLFWPHIVDLWRPTDLVVDGNFAAADITYELAKVGQKCHFMSTSEVDTPTSAGRSKVVNIMTLDHIQFPQGIVFEDTWIMRASSYSGQFPLDDSTRYWVLQGNPQSMEAAPFQLVGVQAAYVKLCPPPSNIQSYYNGIA